MKLPSKILAIIIPIISAFIIIVGLFTYSYIVNDIDDELMNKNYVALQQMKQSIESHQSKSILEFSMIAKNDRIQNYLNDTGHTRYDKYQRKLIKFIENRVNSNLHLKEFYIFNENKKIDFIYSEDIFYEISSDMKWLGEYLSRDYKSGSIISDIVMTSNGTRFVFAQKIEPTNSYLIITEDTNSISDLIYNVNAEYESAVVLLHNSNTLVSKGTLKEQDGFKEKILKEYSNNITISEQPMIRLLDKNFYLYKETIENNLSLINVTSKEKMFEYIISLGLIMLLFGAVFTALLSLTIYLSLNKYVLKPIKEIKSASENISNGDYSDSLAVDKKDELSDLSRSINNMSEKIQNSNERINNLAYFDELTGLSNKRNFDRKLKEKIFEARKQNKNVSMMLLDLDDFKEVNDMFGHHTGDKFLKEIAKRITATIEEHSTSNIGSLVSRIAGDEFVVMLCGNNLSKISTKIAKEIVFSISNPLSIDDVEFYPSASLGMSIYPNDGDNAIDIFKNADMAMYEAKRKGKNQYSSFELRMLDKLLEKESINSDLRKALAEDEFELYFQPKYNIARGNYSQFEALLRWNHKERGWISPAIFIPYAEESSLIIDIGNWVIASVCEHVNKLEKLGWSDFKISFNVSFKQMQDKRFVHILKNMIYKYGINPNHLEMEITEYTLVKNIDHAIVELTKIKNIGISIALDDFGTGYSSMAYLQNLPLDTLKIDRIFVSKSTTSQKDKTIIDTIITLAKGLSLKTVAEGVETLEEYETVKELGTDLVQGYYFYKPLEFNEVLNINKSELKQLRCVNES